MITALEEWICTPSFHDAITQDMSIIVGRSSRLSVTSDAAGFHGFLQSY